MKIGKVNWTTGQLDPTPVQEAVAIEVLEYLFNSKQWHDSPEELLRRVRAWKTRLFVDILPADQRREKLAAMLTVNPRLPLREAAKVFGVSYEQIRLDLKALKQAQAEPAA